MLGDISGLEKIYIVCGHTDMRKSIDGLCTIVEKQLKMDPGTEPDLERVRLADVRDRY